MVGAGLDWVWVFEYALEIGGGSADGRGWV